ncbi:hypothetical protein CL655_01945 [bacterium]|nr:hypothetical protein [bacterium]
MLLLKQLSPIQKAALAAFCCVWLLSAALTANAQTSTPSATGIVLPQASDFYQVTQLEGEQNFGDFVVGPGKFDLTIAPGESETIEILITNRTGIEKEFSITTEDITGSNDTETATVLLGEDEGPYTLRDFIEVAADRFIIGPGQRVTVPITVRLPADAEPGGRYGSLLVQTASANLEEVANTPSAAVVSRIAVLFFVKTPGELNQEGKLIDFVTVPDQRFFNSGPITFGLLYENTGTVHTNPAGEITINNMFGQNVGYVEALPWFSLPQSLRLREVSWDRTSLLGYYTAEARVYRGYGKEIDTLTTSFWVIDWRLLASVTAALLALFIIIRFFTKRFTFVRREP